MKVSKATFLFFLVVNFIISLYVANRVHDELRDKENALLELYTTRLQTQIESYAQTAKTFKVIIENHNGALSDEEFEGLAGVMYDPNVKQTIAFLPDGIVTQVFPLQEYIYTVGFNVFEDERTRSDSIRAKETGELVVSGPFELVHGDIGFVIRIPVYVDEEFIGFTAVSMVLDLFLEQVGITNLEEFGYQYKLTTIYDGVEVIAYETNSFDENMAVVTVLQIENNENTFTFKLYIRDRVSQVFLHVIFWFVVMLSVSLVLYFILSSFEKNKTDLIQKLEKDPLTGAYNRTRLYNFATTNAQDFALLFIDLNKFKPVNDTFGHDVGDKLLVAYVQRLRSHMPKNAIILRLGGDEFVVIVPNIVEDTIQSIVRRIKIFSEEVFSIDDNTIYISASVGCVLSYEANSIEDLIELADKKMYYEKHRTRESVPVNSVLV